MKRDSRVYLDDILEAIQKIENYTRELTLEEFHQDDKSLDAVVRNLAIIGEAVKHIPYAMRQNNPNIPWKEMAGMRDKLVHEYFGIRYDIIWKTVKERLPNVGMLIKSLITQLDEK